MSMCKKLLILLYWILALSLLICSVAFGEESGALTDAQSSEIVSGNGTQTEMINEQLLGAENIEMAPEVMPCQVIVSDNEPLSPNEPLISEELIPSGGETPASPDIMLADSVGSINMTPAYETENNELGNEPSSGAVQGASQKSVTVSPSSVNAGTLTPGAAKILRNAAVVTVISKKLTWGLTVSAGNFTYGNRTIPPERVMIKLSTQPTYMPLSSAPLTLLSNQVATNGTNLNIDYQILLLSSDLGGTFSGNITFTVI